MTIQHAPSANSLAAAFAAHAGVCVTLPHQAPVCGLSALSLLLPIGCRA